MSASVPSAPRRIPGILRSVAGLIPTALVLGGLGAVGWWGHTHNWKLPKASELRGEIAEKDDWCDEHNVPESVCLECHPEMEPKKSEPIGWCNAHGIPDCTLCNPDRSQLAAPPSVTPDELARAKSALDFAPRQTNLKACTLHRRRIQLADDEAATKSGILTDLVGTASERDPMFEFVAAAGELGYDQTKVAHLSSRSPGSVAMVFKRLGDKVKRGDVLAIVEAAEVGKAKSELLLAHGLLQLKIQIVDGIKNSGGAVPELRLREAEAAVKETELRIDGARQALVNLGLAIDEQELRGVPPERLKAKLHFLAIPAEIAAGLDSKKTSTGLLPLLAPMDGTVVSRDVAVGEVVDFNKSLFELIDTRSLWLTLDVRGEDAAKLKLGQPVRFKPDSNGPELAGAIAWISTQADSKTRAVKVRANIPDAGGVLKSNTFGSGRVILREDPNAVVVPNAAVQFEGCCHVVFVSDKTDPFKLFHVRKVRIGAKDDRRTEIIAGLFPGERIATSGSGMLLSELLRSGLGEGCACHGAKKE